MFMVAPFLWSQWQGHCYSTGISGALSAAEYVVMTTSRPPVADVDQDLPVHVSVCIYACVVKVKVFSFLSS